MGSMSLELGHNEQPAEVLTVAEALALGLAHRIQRNGDPHIVLSGREARAEWVGLGGLMQLDELRQQRQEGEQ